MASKFETGHFINLSNFGTLISYLGTQPLYSPDATDLSIAQLTTYKQEVEDATNALVTEAAQLQQVINDRIQTFEQMRKLATRIMRYLEANSLDHEAIKDVRTFYKELQSKALNKKQVINEDGSVSEKTYSSSRLSYHSKAEHFQQMVARLATMPVYNPSDNTISLASLQAMSQTLNNHNAQVNTKYQLVTNARNERDNLMYQKDTGLVDKALRVKKYLQYKYGTQSDQYTYANSLRFTKKQVRKSETIPSEPPIDQ